MWSYSAVVCSIVDAGIAQSIPEFAGFGFLIIVLIPSIFVVPVFLWQLFGKITMLYKGESAELDFWAEKGRWTLRKALRTGYAVIITLIVLIIIYISAIRIG